MIWVVYSKPHNVKIDINAKSHIGNNKDIREEFKYVETYNIA